MEVQTAFSMYTTGEGGGGGREEDHQEEAQITSFHAMRFI